MRRTRLLLILGSLAGAAVALPALLIQPACSAGACTQSLLDPNTPSPALECAAGLLCYQGQCIKACSAGQEGAQQCTDDGECNDGSRPRCLNGYCSACDDGEECVPTLNICQPTTEIDLSMIPIPPTPPPGSPKPPEPLDAGWIDGGLRLDKDAGVEIPVDAVVTHAGLVDVAVLVDYYGSRTTKSKVRVTMRDVHNVNVPGLIWRVDPYDDVLPASEPVTETIIEEALGEDCTLSALMTYTGTISLPEVDVGIITIDTAADFPGSITRNFIIPFTGDYADPQDVEANVLQFSTLIPKDATHPNDGPHFLSISGSGSMVTQGAWPSPVPENGEHVPFELKPATETVTALENGFGVNVASPGDLVVRWDAIRAGSVPGEAVVLRLRTHTHEITCIKQEGNVDGALIIKAGLLGSLITRDSIVAGEEFPIYFERAFARRTDVVPANMTTFIDLSVRVRHTFVGKVRFD